MNFVTVSDSKYYPMASANVRNIRKLHPDSLVCVGDAGLNPEQVKYLTTIGAAVIKLDMGLTADVKGKKTLKPIMAFRVLSLTGGPVCLMDGDAILVRPMDINADGFDAVVTIRVSQDGWLNSGVVILNNTMFVAEWIAETFNNVMHNRGSDFIDQPALIKLCESEDYKILHVPCSTYNYTTVEKGIPDDVRAVHLKGSHRHTQKNINKASIS